MTYDILILIGLTLLPFLELRASIPYGILVLDMNWLLVFFICVTANAVLGPIVFFVIDKIISVFLKVDRVDKIWNRLVERPRRKVKKYVDEYGELGVSLFIGIPLPGSGSYSGSLGSYLLGLSHRRFALANLIGVVIAGTLVTAIVLSGSTAWSLFVKA